ncbi:MAG: PAS domain-containing protein, partial [Rubrivivax sp.]
MREDVVHRLLRDELQSRQALLESAVRAMNDGIWIGDTLGTTLAMNQAFIDMHGLSAQEASSPTLEGWIHSLRWT